MQFFGIFSLLFGVLIVSYPEFLAYLIGFFFVFLGINILAASWFLRRPNSSGQAWKVGSYEITRRK